jgi:hypothetical protein
MNIIGVPRVNVAASGERIRRSRWKKILDDQCQSKCRSVVINDVHDSVQTRSNDLQSSWLDSDRALIEGKEGPFPNQRDMFWSWFPLAFSDMGPSCPRSIISFSHFCTLSQPLNDARFGFN